MVFFPSFSKQGKQFFEQGNTCARQTIYDSRLSSGCDTGTLKTERKKARDPKWVSYQAGGSPIQGVSPSSPLRPPYSCPRSRPTAGPTLSPPATTPSEAMALPGVPASLAASWYARSFTVCMNIRSPPHSDRSSHPACGSDLSQAPSSQTLSDSVITMKNAHPLS